MAKALRLLPDGEIIDIASLKSEINVLYLTDRKNLFPLVFV